MFKKAMVITMEDQVSYCNKTIQVGPHLLVVTTATMDTSGESLLEEETGHAGQADSRRKGDFLHFFFVWSLVERKLFVALLARFPR